MCCEHITLLHLSMSDIQTTITLVKSWAPITKNVKPHSIPYVILSLPLSFKAQILVALVWGLESISNIFMISISWFDLKHGYLGEDSISGPGLTTRRNSFTAATVEDRATRWSFIVNPCMSPTEWARRMN